jgi:hypothetical protein
MDSKSVTGHVEDLDRVIHDARVATKKEHSMSSDRV